MIKLSYSILPNVTSLSTKSNIKNLEIINVLSPQNAILLIKLILPSKESVSLEHIRWKYIVRESNNSNISRNVKVYIGSTQAPFKKQYYNHITHEIYT